MLTLAFSQMFYAYTFQVSWLGAEDGLVGIPRPTVPGVDLASLRGFHAYLLALVVLVALALWRIVRSPFGARAARHPRERGAHGGAGLRGGPLQAAGLRDRGDRRGGGRLALHPVQRLDHPGRVLLEDVGRGAADGDHRRHRHARRGAAGRGRVHPAPEPGQHLHRALDADPRHAPSSCSCSSPPAGSWARCAGASGCARERPPPGRRGADPRVRSAERAEPACPSRWRRASAAPSSAPTARARPRSST